MSYRRCNDKKHLLSCNWRVEESYQIWEKTLKKWEQLFQQDSGDAEKNLQLRLVCDGIWYSIMNHANLASNKQIEAVVKKLCKTLEGVG